MTGGAKRERRETRNKTMRRSEFIPSCEPGTSATFALDLLERRVSISNGSSTRAKRKEDEVNVFCYYAKIVPSSISY